MADPSRSRIAAESGNWQRKASVRTPAQLVAITFLVAIAVGTVLLGLPFSHTEAGVGLLDALFTATSAVCVTGLVVVDTGSAYNEFGQFVILVLIQIGGLGILTFGTILALATGRQIGVGERLRVQHQISYDDSGTVVAMVSSIVRIVVIAELSGALVLYIRMAPEEGALRGAWYALFHSVSAFNNAGFSLYQDSLSRYVSDPIVSLTIIALVVVGGLGFIVITNVKAYLDRGLRVRLSLHTRMVLVMTAVLIAFATTSFLIFESHRTETFGNLSGPDQILAALFAAVTPRTAGFNSVDYAQLTNASLVLTMLLMFVGGNSGSTAGGVKTTTVFVLGASVWSVIRGRPDTVVFDRRIPVSTVVRAGAVVFGALTVAVLGITLLALFEPDVSMRDVTFEGFSAIGTAGLSTGITGALSSASKVVLMVLMFLGRIGSVSLALALVAQHRSTSLRLPAEEVVIG